MDFLKRNKITYPGKRGEDTKFVIECLLAFYKEHGPSNIPNFQKITNSGYNYRLFSTQSSKAEDFQKDIFFEFANFTETRLSKFKELGLQYYILAILFVTCFRLYLKRANAKNLFLKNIYNLEVKLLTILSVLISGSRFE